jgi:ferredoxin
MARTSRVARRRAALSRSPATTPPARGQQYAFEVDLDKCSGCKSCVAACHSLNGLDDGEAWRTIGRARERRLAPTLPKPLPPHAITAWILAV